MLSNSYRQPTSSTSSPSYSSRRQQPSQESFFSSATNNPGGYGMNPENPIHVVSRPAPMSSKEKFWSAVKLSVAIWAAVALYTLYSEELGRVQGKNFSIFNEVSPDEGTSHGVPGD